MAATDTNAPPEPPATPRGPLRRLGRLARRIHDAAPRAPGPILRPVLRRVHDANWVLREAWEWAWRSFVATPLFLAQCESHGSDVWIDRMPYMVGRGRIRIGSHVRISGHIGIGHSSRYGKDPLLSIGSGVFIGHACSLNIAERVEIGDYVSIGGGTFIADTTGHSHMRLDGPIWEDPATPRDIAPVVIEKNVHIGRGCVILKGVRIGAGAIIGAHTVVRSRVRPGAIVAGNPARVVGFRSDPTLAALPSPPPAEGGAAEVPGEPIVGGPEDPVDG
jgi:NDP-sugar pyrophosphorylase family protein